MSDQVENTSAVDTAAETTATANTPKSKSFQCISPKSDWHILGIAFFTSIITIVIYHFVIMAVNEFCSNEEEKVFSCYCHQNNNDEENQEDEVKKQRRKAFFDKLTPEQRDHLKTLKTKEERREYLRSIFKDRAPKDRPFRGKGPRKDRKGKRFAPPRQPRIEAPAQN